MLQLVEKTANWDKDERYMAANDLSNILSRDVKIDEHVEQKICAAILKLLGGVNPTNILVSFALIFCDLFT